MSDALVSPVVAGTMLAGSMLVAAYSLHKIKQNNDQKLLPIMGVMGAVIFAAQMVNFAIPGTGASGHITGGMLLSAILGPYAGFITMIGILTIQCLLFADGGILALGCNIWNMAFYGCFIGALLIWGLIMRNGLSKRKIIISSLLGSIITLQLGAFSVSAETFASGITNLPFSAFVIAMQPIHLAIGFVEGLITASVLCFIYKARPELLWTSEKEQAITKTDHFFLQKPVILTLILAFVFIAGGLSLFASSQPDGLEWSVNKTHRLAEIHSSGYFNLLFSKIQNVTALFPDYSLKHINSGTGTSFSGIIGGFVVISVFFLIKYIIQITDRK